MSSCCPAGDHGASNELALCPVSGTTGSPVEQQTVKALLTVSALRRLSATAHRFCPDPACDVVYFAEDGQAYVRADIRVSVWQKERFGARVICYCFGENEADIGAEIDTRGKSEAEKRVREHIQAGRCACEVRNPRGVCCLGELGAAVKRVAEALSRVDVSRTDRSVRWTPTEPIKSASLRREAD